MKIRVTIDFIATFKKGEKNDIDKIVERLDCYTGEMASVHGLFGKDFRLNSQTIQQGGKVNYRAVFTGESNKFFEKYYASERRIIQALNETANIEIESELMKSEVINQNFDFKIAVININKQENLDE